MSDKPSSEIIPAKNGGGILKITLTALFLALAVVLPMAFHIVGLGARFLPMYIPVILAGMLIGPGQGAAVGLLAPILSSTLTGMPPLIPITPIMTAELLVIGAISGILAQKFRLRPIITTLLTAAAGRIVFALVIFFFAPVLIKTGYIKEGVSPMAFIGTSLLFVIPGIILQLVAVPSVFFALDRISTLMGTVKEKL